MRNPQKQARTRQSSLQDPSTIIEQNHAAEYKSTHKELRLILQDHPTQAEMGALSDLNLAFSDRQLHLENEGILVDIYVRSVDMDKLRSQANDIGHKHFLPPTNLLTKVIEEIESVGSYSFKGHKRFFVGYNKERKVSNRKDKEKKRGAFFYARGNKFLDSNVPLPNEYSDQIISGDSEIILKKLPDNCIDLTFTSPPYNFGLEYESHSDEVVWETYFKKLFAIFEECVRVTKFGGRIVINVQPLFSDYIPIHHLISNFFVQKKLIWRGEILWEKHNYNCKYTAWGSWKSPSNPYLKYTWEFLEVFCKGALKHSSEGKSDILADEFKKWVYAKWEIPPETRMKKWGHPAMFPEELAKRSIKLFSFEGDTVLDPFNGVGTTTKVAKELGRKYLGIDVSKEYCEKARIRLQEIVK